MTLLFITFLIAFVHFGSSYQPTDPSFIAACLDVHNSWRSQVALGQLSGQPSGSNIRKMEWSSALAKVAHDYSGYLCANDLFKHNDNKKSQAANEGYPGALEVSSYQVDSVGENLAWYSAGSDSIALVEAMVKMWFDEHVDYTYSECCPGNFGAYGHYSQGVWAESHYVGCGYVSCSNGRYLTCNYGAAGNYPQYPYTTGSACKNCPNGFTNCDSGLCSRVAPTPQPTPRPTTPQPTPPPSPTPPPQPTPQPTNTPAPTTRAPTDAGSACTGGCFSWTISLPVNSQAGDTCDQFALAFAVMITTYNLHISRKTACVLTIDGYGSYDKLAITWRVNGNERDLIWNWINSNNWFGSIHHEMDIIRGSGASGNVQPPAIPPEEARTGTPICEDTECGGETHTGGTKTPTGLIIGVVIASICLCSLILGGFFWYNRNKAQSNAYFELQEKEKETYAPPSQP